MTTERETYEARLKNLQLIHHSRCMFNGSPMTEGITFSFRDNGQLTAIFQLAECHMGYDGIAHGGVIAAIVDASMAQCLMGHGVVGYTTDLAIRYRKPLRIGVTARLITRITGTEIEILHSLQTEIRQGHHIAVQATGRFCRTDAFSQR